MDLRWSAAEEAFRGEARGWLEANVPRSLPSGDTRAGFAAHRALIAESLGVADG
jgi:hypothetical protein